MSFQYRIFFLIMMGAECLNAAIAIAQPAKLPVKVHSPGRSILSLPFQIAEDQEFYKDEGINVEFLVMPTGAGVQALIAGDVDASQILGLTLRAAINRGAPLKIAMVFNDRPTYSLMSRKDITNPEDLKGKIIASSSPGASSDVLLQRWLTQKKLAPRKDLTIVYIGATAITYQALARGSVAAAVLVPPFDARSKTEGFYELSNFGKEDLGPFLGGGVSVSDKFLHERPDAMTRFLRGTWKALRLLKTNRKVSLGIMEKSLNLTPEIAGLVYDSTIGSFTDYGFNSEDWQIKLLEHEVGRGDRSLVRKTFDFSVVKGFR